MMRDVQALLFSIPILSTLGGGILALRFRRFHLVLGAVGAGLLLGAAFLDLLPEAIDLGKTVRLNTSDILGLTLLGFLVFHFLERGLESWSHRIASESRRRQVVRRTGAVMLIFHSFRDGMAIGAAYAASHAAGIAVALGIAVHDLGDGMNTVILTTGGDKPTRTDYLFLVADAVAPFLGGLLTVWWVLSTRSSVVLLSLTAGFFLQMSTGDLLPDLRDSARRHLMPSVLVGALVIYAANLLIAHR